MFYTFASSHRSFAAAVCCIFSRWMKSDSNVIFSYEMRTFPLKLSLLISLHFHSLTHTQSLHSLLFNTFHSFQPFAWQQSFCHTFWFYSFSSEPFLWTLSVSTSILFSLRHISSCIFASRLFRRKRFSFGQCLLQHCFGMDDGRNWRRWKRRRWR